MPIDHFPICVAVSLDRLLVRCSHSKTNQNVMALTTNQPQLTLMNYSVNSFKPPHLNWNWNMKNKNKIQQKKKQKTKQQKKQNKQNKEVTIMNSSLINPNNLWIEYTTERKRERCGAFCIGPSTRINVYYNNSSYFYSLRASSTVRL